MAKLYSRTTKAYYREDVMGSGSCVTVVKSTGRFMQVGGLA